MQKRELKFRYVLERMGKLRLFDISLIDCEIESSNFERFRQLTVFDGWSIIEALQYFGLRDDEGKEICEGDILKDDYGRILLVEWYKYGFSFNLRAKKSPSERWGMNWLPCGLLYFTSI